MNPAAMRRIAHEYAALPPVERLRRACAARERCLGAMHAQVPVPLGPRGPLAGLAVELLGRWPSPAWAEAVRLRLLSLPVWHQGHARGQSRWSLRDLTAEDLARFEPSQEVPAAAALDRVRAPSPDESQLAAAAAARARQRVAEAERSQSKRQAEPLRPWEGLDPAPDLADQRRAVLALVSELPYPEGRARAEADVAGARTREELQDLRELVLATLGHAPSPDAASDPAGAPNGSSRERYEAEVPSQRGGDLGR